MSEPSGNKPDQLIRQIDKWSAWLTAVVVAIPFIVSFGALKDLAQANGVNYPFMYPLMIDLSLIIFNLIALRSSLHGERNLYAWSLVMVATVISVALNIVHAPNHPLPMFMAALPPLFILAAFHLVVLRIEHSARRNQAVLTLEKLVALTETARSEHQQLSRQREAVNHEIQTQQEQLAAMHEQLEAARRELSNLKREQSRLNSEPSVGDNATIRRERLLAMLNDPAVPMTQLEMAEALGVSVSTIRRDLQSLNGKVAQ